MPAIVKILTVFAAMLGLTRLRVPLGGAVVLGGIGLELWAGRGAAQTARDLGAGLASLELWLFVGVTILMVDVGRFVAAPRQSAVVLGAVRRWGGRHGWAWSAMAMPAAMGLIPMPAGALISAPLVEQATVGTPRDVAWKTAVNYWFRHTWEFWWPLYPGVIVAMSILHVETWQFVAAQIALTPLAMGAGWFFLVRPHRREPAPVPPAAPADAGSAWLVALPLALTVGGALALPAVAGWALPALGSSNRKLLALALGLGAAMAAILAMEHRRGGSVRQALGQAVPRRREWTTTLTVAGVLLFKTLLDHSGLLPDAGRDLVASGIPLPLAVAGLPFLAGLVTGLAIGYAGASMPLVAGLMAQPAAGLTPMATVALAYSFGYVGMMLTPLHLCFAMSRDYFGSSWRAVYRLFVPCLAVVLAYAVLAFTLFRALGW